MGSVTIERQRSLWRDLIRAYRVEIDGQIVGSVRSGKSFCCELTPGSHSIRLTIDWCSSQTLKVFGDEDTKLVCAPGGTALTALPDIVIDTDHYIALSRTK